MEDIVETGEVRERKNGSVWTAHFEKGEDRLKMKLERG